MTLTNVCFAADAFGCARRNWAKESLVLPTGGSEEWSPLLGMSPWASPVVRTAASALPSALLALWSSRRSSQIQPQVRACYTVDQEADNPDCQCIDLAAAASRT